jgi:hypothetical protein
MFVLAALQHCGVLQPVVWAFVTIAETTQRSVAGCVMAVWVWCCAPFAFPRRVHASCTGTHSFTCPTLAVDFMFDLALRIGARFVMHPTWRRTSASCSRQRRQLPAAPLRSHIQDTNLRATSGSLLRIFSAWRGLCLRHCLVLGHGSKMLY